MGLKSASKAIQLRYGLFLLCLFSAKLCASGASITVAVATNFKPLLSELAPSFSAEHHIKVRISSASTGVLYNQIRQGAPFDVFLSADSERPALLEQQNLIVANSRATFALGQLVLVSHDQSLVASQQLLQQWQGPLAIANPRIAPYGLAAQQTLSYLKLWPWAQGDRSKLVRGNSVAQTFQFVHSGNIKLALVVHAQVKGKSFAGGVWQVPNTMYQPIAQQLVVLKATKQISAANRFAHWLLAPEQQQRIMAGGYAIVSEKGR